MTNEYVIDTVLEGDCLVLLRDLRDDSLDAIVTDPPYGLGTREPTVEEIVAYLTTGADLDTRGDFMNKRWSIPSVAIWRECLRVLKPGGHLLSFGGTRTWDLISLGLRAAGFELRDTIADEHAALQWLHAQGFPKSLNVSKAIDREAGATREIIGPPTRNPGQPYQWSGDVRNTTHEQERASKTAPATPEAQQWEGWGTALKPSWEPILVFRKPLEGRVVDNVLTHGTGALNVGACRVEHSEECRVLPDQPEYNNFYGQGGRHGETLELKPEGRWPPNMTLTHAPGCRPVGTRSIKGDQRGDPGGRRPGGFGDVGVDKGDGKPNARVYGDEEVPVYECVEGCPVLALSEASGERPSAGNRSPSKGGNIFNNGSGVVMDATCLSKMDSGTAARYYPHFHYTPKANSREATMDGRLENTHPTRKPLALMRWLVKLVTPKNGIVLDPFCGSGTTLHAAILEQRHFIGMEREPEYVELSRQRVQIAQDDLNKSELQMKLAYPWDSDED